MTLVERLIEQAVLAEYVRRNATALGHDCYLESMAGRRRNALLDEVVRAIVGRMPTAVERDLLIDATRRVVVDVAEQNIGVAAAVDELAVATATVLNVRKVRS